MSIPREFIELLLAKIDLVDLINMQVPLRKKSGSNYFARCPFHNEKNASFSVSQTKQFYYCFGCGAHGNAIDFLMQHDRLSFPEAVETLARQAAMEVPHTAQHVKREGTSVTELYDLMQKVSAYYYDQMCKSPRAINYLKSRALTGETAQLFQLGYAPTQFSHVLDHFGNSNDNRKKLLEVGLIIHRQDGSYYDRFRDRIIFPIHDHRGRIIGFGGRIIDQGEPKYLNSPETVLFQKGHELYGLYQTLKAHRKLERVLVVEGYLDVITLFQHGITYAVATLGTATTSHHLQRLFRYTSDIIFCFDGDEAGRTAAWRALQVIFPVMHDSLQVRFLFLPEGEDPDSLVRKEGKSKFEKRLNEAASLSTFFFHNIGLQSNLETMEGRARFATLALTHIKQLPAGLFQGILLDELAKRARVNVDELKQQIKHPDEIPQLTIQDNTKTKLPAPLRLAMSLIVQNPHLAGLVTAQLPKSDLPGFNFLIQLIELIQKRPNITTGMLIEYWRGHKEERFIAKLAHFDHLAPEEGVEQEFMGAIRQLNSLNFDETINRLLAKAAQEGLSEQEKVELNESINKKKALALEAS